MTQAKPSMRGGLVSQFKNPHGLLGHLAGWVLAWRPSNRARNFWTVGLLGVGQMSRVLEIGCGPGVGLKHLLSKFPDATALGVDRSDVMIAQAKVRNRKAVAANRLNLVLGEIGTLTEPPASFDCAYSINVIQFVDKPADFAAGLGKLMKPGGVIATTLQPRGKTANAGAARARLESFAGNLADCGFAKGRIEMLELKPVPALCLVMKKTCPETPTAPIPS